MVDGSIDQDHDGYQFACELAAQGKKVVLVSGRRYSLPAGVLYLDKDDYSGEALLSLVHSLFA